MNANLEKTSTSGQPGRHPGYTGGQVQKAAPIFSLRRIYTPVMLVTLLGLVMFMGVMAIMGAIAFVRLISSVWLDQEHRWLVIGSGLAVMWTAWRWKKLSS
jgi:hypothetical protein